MSGNSRVSRILAVDCDMETIDSHLPASSVVEEAKPEKGDGENKSERFESTAPFSESIMSLQAISPRDSFRCSR